MASDRRDNPRKLSQDLLRAQALREIEGQIIVHDDRCPPYDRAPAGDQPAAVGDVASSNVETLRGPVVGGHADPDPARRRPHGDAPLCFVQQPRADTLPSRRFLGYLAFRRQMSSLNCCI